MMPWSVSGKGKLVGRALFEEQLRELFCVERVAPSPLEEDLLRVRIEDGPVEEACDEPRRLLVGERGYGERRRVELPAAPAGSALEQLGARRRDDEQRHIGHPIDELVDEVEQAFIGPVEILEDEHERPPFGHRLEEESPRRECLAAAVFAELALSRRVRPARGDST